MILQKTYSQIKHFKKKIKEIKNITHYLSNHGINKEVSNISCRNKFNKSRQKKFFSRTMGYFNIDKFKLKNSTSSLFQSNDIDLVHNLNIDNIGQMNDDSILKDNLINSLEKKTKGKEDQEIGDYLNEKIQKKQEQIKFPKLEIIKGLNKYKSFELIQTHKKKLQNDMTDHLQKELINKLKNMRVEINGKKKEKNDIFKKIKKIEHELEGLNMENYLSKKKFKKQFDDIAKKSAEESLNNKTQAKLKANQNKFINFNKIFKSDNISSDSQNNNLTRIIKTPSQLSLVSNKNNETQNQKKEKINNINNILPPKTRKSISKKSFEKFKVNLLQSQLQKEFEMFLNSQKEKELNMKLNKKNLENELKKLDKELEKTKKEEKEIIRKLMQYYKEILFKGKPVKKDGLVWVVKAIWYLGENVPMSFLPPFLDFDSIEYLFKLAHKQLEIEYFTKKVHEMKLSLKKDISDKYKNDFIRLKIKYKSKKENNNSLLLDKSKFYINMKKANNESISEEKKNVYLDLVKEFEEKNRQFELMNLPEINRINSVKEHLQKIKDDIIKLKQNEIKRISKCFIENNYEEIYHTNIETVLSALIGTDTKDTEMNKYHILKKNHMLKLKKIRFFDHEHVRKIFSIKE